jgi:hypothetical protein
MSYCICPQYPVFQIDPTHYVFYAQRFEGGCVGNLCNAPTNVSVVGSISTPWPQTCPDCGFLALATDEAPEPGIPAKKSWDFVYPNEADAGHWAQCIHCMNTDRIAFWFNRIRYVAKVFIVRFCFKELDPTLGSDIIACIGFEVENHPAAQPTYEVPAKYVEQLSANVYRVRVGSIDYLVFTAVQS